MNRPSLARQLVRELGAIDPSSVDDATVDKATLCLFDYLSCVFAGRQLPYGQQAISASRRWSFDAGVTVPATGLRLAPGEAAYVASVLAASASRTDMHAPSTSHPAAVVFPVAMACAGIRPLTGSEFLCAVIAGYECMGRLGRVVVDDHFRRRFRATSVLGAIGGAVTASILLRLDESAAVSALALAANAAAGLMAWGHTGEVDLFYQPANAARASMTAVLLAREGATGSEAIFESPAGFLDVFGGLARANELLQPQPEGWEIGLVDYKPFPACVFVQAAGLAAAQVAAQGVSGDRVVSARLRAVAPAIDYPGCNEPGPITSTQAARMSLQFTVASVLARGELNDRNFTDINNPSIARIAKSVSVESDPDLTSSFPERHGAQLEVLLSDGKVVIGNVSDVPPVTPALVRERFRVTAREIYPTQAADEIEAKCISIRGMSDVRELLSNLVLESV